MSLKYDYYNGLTGLNQTLDAAFDAGFAFVGAGVEEESILDIGTNNGTTLATASTGLYVDVPDVSGVTHRMWFFVASETAPSGAGVQLTQVNIGSGDNSATFATKLAAALNGLLNQPFSATAYGSAVDIVCNLAGVTNGHANVGTLVNNAFAVLVTAGTAPSGNFLQIQAFLKSMAAQGLTSSVLTVATSFQPVYLRANNANNLLLKAYLAGVQSGLAAQNIYNYECTLDLNTSDTVTTGVDFNFNFAST